MKYLIIGGVAGGATVAARLRRMDEKAEIILFERGKYVSYANCGLPYYIGDTINDRNKLFVQTVKGFTDRFRIDIRTEQEVTRILPESKQVEVKKLGTGETYDKLVLSPGAEPLRPRIEGIESKKIFTLRNVPDTDTIKNYVNTEKPRTAVVVGGGFIGLEMAENLHELGVHVTVVEMANQVMAPLDYSMAAIVHQQLIGKQVGLMLEDGVSRFEETSRGVTVHLKSGKQIPADMVLLSIGVRPETRLAKEAGLTIGALGGIAVNEYMQTSNPDIYALGDAVEVRHLVTGKPALIPLAGPANKQGRIVADNIVSGNKEPDKFAHAGFHAVKSAFVNAPVIEELPMTLECELVSYDPETCFMTGRIVNISVDEAVLGEDGKVDVTKLKPITYDPIHHDYLEIGKKVGNAFSDGKKLK